ncbi:MAG: hypothetical protein JWQ81_6508 [Amycolatopsis sp.]|uniref:hypothetical protein n=1 Tax=Amycolatopsis sp. TaxID=37632 RepID=UPI0026032B68|nr:hypothetical protein [Amycolatopsis sp.]MCU1685769.1 hypothetical protein [Amycolatopsis sp.]
MTIKITNVDVIITQASKKLGHREALIGLVVTDIANHHWDGWSDAKITADLQHQFGADAPQAQLTFVRWITRKL